MSDTITHIAGPIMPVVLAFDPFANEETAEVFNDDLARTIYLLWRRKHIISDGFAFEVLGIAKNLREIKPATPEAAERAFPTWAYGNFGLGDVKTFCREHFEYLTGEKTAEWEIRRD